MNLDAPLPAEVGVGSGTALFIHGTCFDAERTIGGLGFVVNDPGQSVDGAERSVSAFGMPRSVSAFGMPRLDQFRALHPRIDPFDTVGRSTDPAAPEDPRLHSYRSGFWGLAPIGPAAPGATLELALTARLDGGGMQTVPLGSVRAAAPPEPLEPSFPGPETQPRVAICMATYEPPLELLARQLDSIRAQSYSNWVCVISDDCSQPRRFEAISELVAGDPRFAVSRSTRRLGFYANFERAVALAPRECDYVALADQDDAWYPDKLAALIEAIGGAQLVYSDMRIVGRGGEVIASSYWERRRNNHRDLTSLLLANSVTGAASLFRRELLDYALPFPPGQFAHYHDHWIALVALVCGGIAYVDRPLHDYVQHGNAAIGHAASTRVFTLRERARKLRTNRGKREPFYRATYFRHVERLMAFATILQMRCGDRLSASHRRSLERFLALERSNLRLAALGWRAARELTGHPETLGAEWTVWRALMWRRVLSASAQRRPSHRIRLDALPPVDLSPPGEVRAIGDDASRALATKIAPLGLAVSEDAPPRVNLLVPTIALDPLAGEFIAPLNLAKRLAMRAARVRVVTVDPVGRLPRDWTSRVESHLGLDGLLNDVEVAFGREAGSVEVNPRDSFVATTWSTAHIAAHASDALGRNAFVYLIQEFEPFASPVGSHAALVDQSYRFEHFALFTSELLRGYFRAHRIGVYADKEDAGDQRSASFETAIAPVARPTLEDLRVGRGHRLLFDARPEPDAAGNMFELGILAIGRALEEGAFRTGWELLGIGGEARRGHIDLGGDVELKLIPRVTQQRYGALLGEHDVGLALIYSPHPSLVSIEMAAAGMLTVTNTFENKTPQRLRAISSNLFAGDPTVDGIAAALRAAAAEVDDRERRVAGSDVRWSRDWDTSFDEPMLVRLQALLSQT